MTYGLTHVLVPVRRLEAARIFYERLGFSATARDGGRRSDLEACGSVIRLTEVRGDIAPVTLRLQAVSIGSVVEALPEVEIRPVRTAARELEAEVRDPDGNRLVFWRRLSEDEYERPEPLPMRQIWQADAQSLMQSLLASVPALFRDVARTGAVAEAEYLAGKDTSVDTEAAVRGFVRATPRLVRSRARQPLVDLGLDPDRYRSDFEV